MNMKTMTASVASKEFGRYLDAAQHEPVVITKQNRPVAITTENLSQFPRLGHVYNPERGLFRLIYAKAFNIYYTIRDQEVFVLFIIDGSISLNQELADPKVTLPEL